MIVRAVQIDQFVAERFQDRSVVGEPLTNWRFVAADGKRALHDQIAVARFDAGFVQLRIQIRQNRRR